MDIKGDFKEEMRNLLHDSFWDLEGTITKDRYGRWLKVEIKHSDQIVNDTIIKEEHTNTYIIKAEEQCEYTYVIIGSLKNNVYNVDCCDLEALTKFYCRWTSDKKLYPYDKVELVWALNDDAWFEFADSFEYYDDDDNPYIWWKRYMNGMEK